MLYATGTGTFNEREFVSLIKPIDIAFWDIVATAEYEAIFWL